MRNDRIRQTGEFNPIKNESPVEAVRCKVTMVYGIPRNLRYAVTLPSGTIIATFESETDANAYADYATAKLAKKIAARPRPRDNGGRGILAILIA